MPDNVTPMKLEAARLWAVATLREVADQLEAAPQDRAAEAMLQVAGAIDDLSRRARRLLRSEA